MARLLERADLPCVARVFHDVFRPGAAVRHSAVVEHMAALYLDSPWSDPAIRPIVHVGADRVVDGFLGVVAIPMLFDGRPMRAGVSGTLMTGSRADVLATMRLARLFLAGPQDLSVSDTLNQISLDVARELRYTLLPAQSLEWTRVLRPGAFGLDHLRRRGFHRLARLGRTASVILDSRLRFRDEAPAGEDTVVDAAGFVAALRELSVAARLMPNWDGPGPLWLLAQAGEKTALGPLRLRVVRRGSGALAGAYAYWSEAGGVATVLQATVRPGQADRLLGSLCRQLRAEGCAAVRGTTHPALMDGLFRMPGVFYRHRAATVVHSRHRDVVAAAAAGETMIGGLVGDSWTRVASDNFDERPDQGVIGQGLRSGLRRAIMGNRHERTK